MYLTVIQTQTFPNYVNLISKSSNTLGILWFVFLKKITPDNSSALDDVSQCSPGLCLSVPAPVALRIPSDAFLCWISWILDPMYIFILFKTSLLVEDTLQVISQSNGFGMLLLLLSLLLIIIITIIFLGKSLYLDT